MPKFKWNGVCRSMKKRAKVAVHGPNRGFLRGRFVDRVRSHLCSAGDVKGMVIAIIGNIQKRFQSSNTSLNGSIFYCRHTFKYIHLIGAKFHIANGLCCAKRTPFEACVRKFFEKR